MSNRVATDSRERWLLPAGFEETLPPRAAQLEALRRKLMDLLATWGYEFVVTPFIEYVDALRVGAGQDLDLRTFKLIDQMSGRLLGVRADMTPQVSRIDAHHLKCEQPVRLCYLGTVLHALPDGRSGSRSPIQVGAELFGHDGVESDAEVLLLMLEMLARAGLEQLHLDIGHVGIYRALAAAAALDDECEARLHEALQRKAHDDVRALLAEFGVSGTIATMLAALAELNGGEEVLTEARTQLAAAGTQVHAHLDRLQALAVALRTRAAGVPLHFDLAELRGYRYHTGVVFAALVPGHGEEVARGGRYDSIGREFGQARPATGFSADLKTLLELGGGEPPAALPGIFAPWSDEAGFDEAVRRLRDAGNRVVYGLPGQSGEAAEMHCDRVLQKSAEGWTSCVIED